MHDQLQVEQFKVLFDIQQKKVLTEIQSLKKELSRVKEELLTELRKVKQDTPPPQELTAPVEQPKTPVPAFQPKVNETSPEADVSIEKIFYVGK